MVRDKVAMPAPHVSCSCSTAVCMGRAGSETGSGSPLTAFAFCACCTAYSRRPRMPCDHQLAMVRSCTTTPIRICTCWHYWVGQGRSCIFILLLPITCTLHHSALHQRCAAVYHLPAVCLQGACHCVLSRCDAAIASMQHTPAGGSKLHAKAVMPAAGRPCPATGGKDGYVHCAGCFRACSPGSVPWSPWAA